MALSQSDLRLLAVTALAEVASDKEAGAAPRASAARTLLEYVGDLGRLAEKRNDDGALGEMTREELEREARTRRAAQTV